jgi:hypothetical protein
LRFLYRNGDLQATGPRQYDCEEHSRCGRCVAAATGHATSRISRDGKKMFVSIGSRRMLVTTSSEKRRARILEFKPDGSGERVYAAGIRNPVACIHPQTGALWTSANERDGLGDHLVPDYVLVFATAVFTLAVVNYIGSNRTRVTKAASRIEKEKHRADRLLQSHSLLCIWLSTMANSSARY